MTIHDRKSPPPIDGAFSFPTPYQVLALLRDLTFTTIHHHVVYSDCAHPEVRYYLEHARAMLYNLSPQNMAKVDRLTTWEALGSGRLPNPELQCPHGTDKLDDKTERESTVAELTGAINTLPQQKFCDKHIVTRQADWAIDKEKITIKWCALPHVHSGSCSFTRTAGP